MAGDLGEESLDIQVQSDDSHGSQAALIEALYDSVAALELSDSEGFLFGS